MSQASPSAITQIREIAAKQQQDSSAVSDFETKFIAEQIARFETYGDETLFSEKQIDLIEGMHAKRVRGEVIEKLSNPTSVAQLKELEKKLLIDVDSMFSEVEKRFLSDMLAQGVAATFSAKQSAWIERLHAAKVRGEKVERPKGKSATPKTNSNK